MAGQTSWTKGNKASLAAGLILILIGVFVAFRWSSHREASAEESERTASVTVTPGLHELGYVGNVRVAGEDVPMGKTSDAFDKATDAQAAKDRVGFDQLKETGTLFTVPSGTEVKMLGSQGAMIHVRVLAGKHKDEDGWTAEEFLK